jgi:MFS family permease
MNSQEIKATFSIGSLYVVRMLGLFMVLPVLPLMADSIAGATPFLIGLALGAYGLSQALLQIPMGIWSDRLGRKTVIIAGLLVFILGSVIAGLSESIYGIIVGRLLQGCGAIASSLLALVGDVTAPNNRTKAMAIVGMSIGASFGIALVLGPFLSVKCGLSGLFLITALLGALGVLVALTFPGETQAPRRDVWDLAGFRQVLKDANLTRVTLGVFALHYLLMSSFVAFPLLMASTGQIPAESHHFYYLGLLVVTFVLMGPLMRMADKPGRALPIALAMIAAFTIANVVLALDHHFYGVMLGMALFFMAFNLLEVVLPAMLSRIAPGSYRGSAMGVYSSAQFAGAFFGGAMGGLIAGGWQITYVLWVNALICVAWFLFTMGLNEPGDAGASSLDETNAVSSQQARN